MSNWIVTEIRKLTEWFEAKFKSVEDRIKALEEKVK